MFAAAAGVEWCSRSDLGGTSDSIPQDGMEDVDMKDDIDGDILGHQWQWQL